MHLSPQTRWDVHRQLAGTADAAPGPRRWGSVPGAAVGGGSSGFDGTLQALLTELSGLKKPRGFVNRVVRRTLGMRPKPPPKYRILVMMASNLPEALDPALLRPGRIDRMYRVGYPSKAGRVRTYQGYLDRTTHTLTPEQVDKLATITPYATGATMKDLVNEALIHAIREGRDVITWQDVVQAKHLLALGPPEDVEYIETWSTSSGSGTPSPSTRRATPSRPGRPGGTWRSTWRRSRRAAATSGWCSPSRRRTSTRSGAASTRATSWSRSRHWPASGSSTGGAGISSLPALQDLGIQGTGQPQDRRGGGGIGFGVELKARRDDAGGPLPQRIEAILVRLLEETEELLRTHRGKVLALAHASGWRRRRCGRPPEG